MDTCSLPEVTRSGMVYSITWSPHRKQRTNDKYSLEAHLYLLFAPNDDFVASNERNGYERGKRRGSGRSQCLRTIPAFAWKHEEEYRGKPSEDSPSSSRGLSSGRQNVK